MQLTSAWNWPTTLRSDTPAMSARAQHPGVDLTGQSKTGNRGGFRSFFTKDRQALKACRSFAAISGYWLHGQKPFQCHPDTGPPGVRLLYFRHYTDRDLPPGGRTQQQGHGCHPSELEENTAIRKVDFLSVKVVVLGFWHHNNTDDWICYSTCG